MRSADFRPVILGTFSFALLIAVWQLLASVGVLNTFLSSSPSLVASALADSATSGELARDLSVSMGELAIGFGLAIVVGIPVGILVGWYRYVEFALDPFIWLGYSAPFVALYPVFIVLFGLGQPTVIVITFLVSVIPMIVNTALGVKGISPLLIQVSRSLGATDGQIFRKIALPSAVPMIMAGLRISIGRALVGVVVGELFGGTAGLGFSIAYYGGLLKTSQMLASVVVIAALGVLLTRLVGILERLLDSWRPEPAHT